MNLIKIGLLSLIVACSAPRQVVQIYKGDKGANGHSIVSAYANEESIVCDSLGGTRLDLYLDMDDSLSVSEGDQYLNSLVACNGLNGLNGKDGLDGADGANGQPGEMGPQGEAGPQGEVGPQGVAGEAGPIGPQGPTGPQGLPGVPGTNGTNGSSATITSYTSSSCTLVVGTSYYVKSNGSNTGVYTSSSCSSSSKEFEMGEGDSMWLSTTQLAVKLVDTNGIRVVKF